jgi:hypothetical protein
MAVLTAIVGACAGANFALIARGIAAEAAVPPTVAEEAYAGAR